MGDPEDAFFASMAMRDLAATVPVRMGVNLGPVRLVKDLNAQMNIIGDGINVAQRVMSFARPGQLLVSRSFYEVVSCLSRDYASLFRHEGSRTDKHVRAHEVYAVVGPTPAVRRGQETDPGEASAPGAARWLAGFGPLGLRRSALLAAPLVFLLIVAGGVGARALLPGPPAKPAAEAPKAPAAQPAAAVAPAAGGAAAVIEVPPPPAPAPKKLVSRPERKIEQARVEKPVAAKSAGRLEIAAAPWGEIFVNGKSAGRTPPLLVIEVPAGAHTVEIRNSTFPAHVAKVEVKAGQSVRVQHRFR
jgi:hypothetical protein